MREQTPQIRCVVGNEGLAGDGGGYSVGASESGENVNNAVYLELRKDGVKWRGGGRT